MGEADLAKLTDATLLRAEFALSKLTRCQRAYAREEARTRRCQSVSNPRCSAGESPSPTPDASLADFSPDRPELRPGNCSRPPSLLWGSATQSHTCILMAHSSTRRPPRQRKNWRRCWARSLPHRRPHRTVCRPQIRHAVQRRCACVQGHRNEGNTAAPQNCVRV